MPTVSINHLTRYRYRRDVAFGEHRILVRPRESYDQRLLSAELHIDPEPATLRWIQDVFGNAVAIATFETEADILEVRGSAEVEHLPVALQDIAVESYAAEYPFQYSAEDLPDLQRSIERHFPDRRRKVDQWALGFLPAGGGRIGSLDLLRSITEAIHERFEYRRREERGIQSPDETLARNGGTCRDFAMLMMEAVRALGLAARFVSGYLYNPGGRERVGAHSTHAWLRVFLPGSGWIEFDPTNGIVGNEGLVRVAVARDPIQALPLSGTWRGATDSPVDMTVDVRIKHLDLATSHPRFPARERFGC